MDNLYEPVKTEGDSTLYYPVLFVTESDLADTGWDITNLEEGLMEKLAEKMSDALMDDFWLVLYDCAKYYNLKKVEEDEEENKESV